MPGPFPAFENYSGTYLKVVRFWEPSGPDDAFVVLYLRPDWRFLYLGYWLGFEYTAAAGNWSKTDLTITLLGGGVLRSDTMPAGETRALERVFTVEDHQHTPALAATGELEGWSLLSWKGPLTYVGQQTVIDPDQRWLPSSLSDVDTWIEKIAPR